MSESLKITSSYDELIPQIEAVIEQESNEIANLANITAILKENFNFFWVGFYIVEGKELVLAPFQGTLACTRIAYGRGVCGRAWELNTTLLVPNVNDFDGHIACSSLSQSEIVIPLRINGAVIGVLDIDSDKINDFNLIDKAGLERVCQITEKMIKRCRNI